MDDDPEPRRVTPYRPPMADAETLVDMGLLDEQPQPPPEEPRVDEGAMQLEAALTDKGVDLSGADQAAVAALAQLDPAVLETLVGWIGDGKTAEK
ncbi:hypothetical protein [Streptomyces sp. H27-H5]|uniref:hypothetical protein n=1 Tax=Streptomyces sp. H27-H5 TaxID=2996460 RepID=UPI00226FFB59|nr:hypothetical protein [Streptomyces sp. H27-H5]MCY0963378.1 hypothetical protein [Streptomyces sp. H27-H5]